MTQSYILKHVLTCPIMGSHGYIFLWNDFGMVQIFHGRFWRHHKRQASPHSIRRHPYFFKTNATLLSSGLNFFFTLISWLAYYSCLRWATHTCLPRRSTIVESRIHKNHNKIQISTVIFIFLFSPILWWLLPFFMQSRQSCVFILLFLIITIYSYYCFCFYRLNSYCCFYILNQTVSI